jgi:hypothetical protein
MQGDAAVGGPCWERKKLPMMISKRIQIATPSFNICCIQVDRSDSGFGIQFKWSRLPTEADSEYCELYFRHACAEENLLTNDELDAIVEKAAREETRVQ